VNNEKTEKVIIIGEIGGSSEEIAAAYLKKEGYPKRVVAFIAGSTAPDETRMGHAGTIVSRGFGTAKSKRRHLEDTGVTVVKGLNEIPGAVK
jgi:succinyl-CoA synthetase alpha subunit